MKNFTHYMKTKIIETVEGTTDEDLIRFLYSTIMEFQIDTKNEKQDNIIELTGTF